ncbi:hypothetical protein AB4Z34_35855, partial [Ensifer sp. 2YAB10]|uniref:hypothetical protein n=1 Tax=Ensifer sp. 2YAB10 TaxID=3233021 RepID=UPI003F8FDA26
LKHATRAMALYYGSGFSRLKLETSSENLWVRTMFEMIGKEFEALQSDRFVSPHGEERKRQILELVTEQESEKLEALARAGEISYRRNLLGGCTKRGELCPYGGVDNVARCGGGDGKMPCADLLYDTKRKAQVIELRGVIKMRLEDAEEGSPDEEALKAQLKAVNNALKVIDGRTRQTGGGVSRSIRPS